VTADDDLDQLYGARPEDFTALRAELVAAAKKRGAADEAKLIGAARRPTAAAWVVNTLVRSDATARSRLAELSEALRAAHAAMDGARIRELTAAQRKLIDQLVRAAFAAAELPDASAALRDDVTGTLQAAIADPDVAARLGRLAKAETWSGFGDFGASTAVAGSARGGRARPRSKKAAEPAPSVAAKDDAAGRAKARQAAQRRRATAAAALENAKAGHDEAVDNASGRRAHVATARRRYEKLLETLSAAEHEVEIADAELDAAETAARRAADDLAAAKAELAEADAALADLG
jgi:hypothetical protein